MGFSCSDKSQLSLGESLLAWLSLFRGRLFLGDEVLEVFCMECLDLGCSTYYAFFCHAHEYIGALREELGSLCCIVQNQ